MDIYKCKKCGERFLSCDLVRTKCSENECGSYMLTFCPKCFGKIEKEQNCDRVSCEDRAKLIGFSHDAE